MIIEIPHWAENANGEAVVRYGDTVVMSTCVMGGERGDLGFFPLTVDYEERYYAAGKIRGSRYMRREGRPSDEAILNSRLIDRSIRPRFPKNLKRDIQIVSTCLSWDAQNDPDVFGLLAASTALVTSDIPWNGPIAALRVGRADGEWVLNPTYEVREKSDADLVFSACLSPKEMMDTDLLINMIEGDCDQLAEDAILQAFSVAKPHLKKLISFQQEIAKNIGKEKIAITPAMKDSRLEMKMKEFLGDSLEKALFLQDKDSRMEEVNIIKNELIAFVDGKYPGEEKSADASEFFEEMLERTLKENILKHEKRSDGRKLDEIRELSVEAGVLPRTHGTGLFVRGQTRALSILTLGAPGDQQLLEGMEIVGKKRFMHHYNFPPYSSGEVKPLRGPGRREIGHGMLAERALMPLIPEFEKFPYTIRAVTEILSSNGSTSMASVSAASIALMDAGVPIEAPATGVAIGIVMDEKGNYKLLTDIQGPEDHHGGMDFKVAGTRKGVTAIQMDVKIAGITEKIMEETLERAKKARHQILDKMEQVLSEPRKQLSPYAPRILTLHINPDKIRDVIGPGGKVINEIIAKTGVTIDVEQTGEIFITSENEESAKQAMEWISEITREAKVGEIYRGKVVRIMDFGAFVELWPGQDGLVHISRLAPWRVNKVTDIVKLGDIVTVKVIEIDEQGRINLSMKEDKNQNKERR